MSSDSIKCECGADMVSVIADIPGISKICHNLLTGVRSSETDVHTVLFVAAPELVVIDIDIDIDLRNFT